MTRMIEWSVSSAALLAVLIALRQILKGKISLRLQYALWVLALLRLLIPFSFGSTAFSVQNALPQQQMRDLPYTAESTYFAYRSQETLTTETESRTFDLPRQWTEFHTNRAELEQSGEKWSLSTYAEVITLKDLALMIWIIGMAAVALCLLGSNLRFGIRLRRSRKLLTNGEALPVYLTGEADTPCLFGLFRPAIYVTPEAAEDPARLRHVIEHELTHYRHGDQYWSLLRGVCLILHWYDPLAWWAAFLSRRDGELACDEATIRRLGEGERAAYGRTLIDMTCHKRPALLVTATTMTGGKGGIRERIRLIAKKPRTAAAALIALLLIAAVAVGCTFTGAKKQEKPQPTATPTEAPATAAPSAEPTAAPGPTPTEEPAADIPASNLYLPSDSMDYETVARDYAGAYAGQFLQAGPDSPYKAEDAMVETRVMEVREDGEAFIFQAHIGFAPAEPDRFAGVIGAGNGGWNEEQQRFYVWRYFCLEKTDGGWTGVDLDVLNYYSEYTAVYGDYFASVPSPRADEAIHRAVMEFNRGNYKSGEFACESHVLVAKESAPGSGGTTAETYYLMILYQEYDWAEGAPKAVSGSYIPSALSFEVSPEEEYTLLEYWTPRDGTYYWDDLRGKFPAGVPDEDLNNQDTKYVDRVHASCDAQARAYFTALREPSDAWLIETALPYGEEYALANGRSIKKEGAAVLRYDDGMSADVVFPCSHGSRFSVSVSFVRGDDGQWRLLPAGAVNLITNRWDNALVRLDMGDQKVPDAVADYAIDTAFLELEYLEQDCGYVFDDARITAITRIDTGTVGLWEGYELYRLEWRFLPAADQEIVLAGGMTVEDGYLTEWGSGGQPYILMGWKESNGVQTWERICVTNTDMIETEYGTPEMLEKYGNAYTAAAMELPARVRGRQSLLDARGFSILSTSSSPLGVGQDWAEAFAQRFTQAREDDPCYCRSMEVRSCELYAESLLNEPKTFVYTMHFACDPADETSFYSQLADWGQDEVHPDWLSFRWFVVLEAASDGWRCVQAGTGGYGSWGYVNYSWDVYELLDRITTEQVGGEDALMLLPLIDWADFGRQYKFGEETWNALWKKLYEACVGEGRYLNRGQSLLWSDVYFYDQIFRNMYVILGFLHSDGAYSEGLATILSRQYAYDPVLFEQSLGFFPEEQQREIRMTLEATPFSEVYGYWMEFFDLAGQPISNEDGWYHLTASSRIQFTWTGEPPEGVRLLYTPVGTEAYDQTRLLIQRSLREEDRKRGEVSFMVSELDGLDGHGQLYGELDYGRVLRRGGDYNVLYEPEVESVTLNRTDITLMRIGESYTLQATVSPEEIRARIRWISQDPKVAAVDENGTVTAVGHGTTKIIAAASGVGATCTVRVTATEQNGNEQQGNDDSRQSVTEKTIHALVLNRVEIILTGKGETYTFQPVFTPRDSNEPLRWTSSDPTVVTVDESGTVTAVSDGKAVIRIAAEKVYAECTVRVEQLESKGVESVIAALHIYDGPTLEKREPEGQRRVILDSSAPEEAEAINDIKSIIDGIRFWTNDEMVDRTQFYFDGDIVFSEREFVYYFSYDKRIIFYDRYFAGISKQDMEYIKSIAG